MPETRYPFRLVAAVLAFALLCIGLGLSLMYRTAYLEAGQRLQDLSVAQSSLVQAVAEFDQRYSGDYEPASENIRGAEAATLSQVRKAFRIHRESDSATEFVLGRMEQGEAVVLLQSGDRDSLEPERIAAGSSLGEPLRRALRGESGLVEGVDIHGTRVLAALLPLPGGGLR